MKPNVSLGQLIKHDTRKQSTDGKIRAFPKRIRESAGEHGLRILKSICLDSNTDKEPSSTEEPNNKKSRDGYMEFGQKASGQNQKTKNYDKPKTDG